MEGLPPVRQGDQVQSALLQGEDGPGLRLRPGQDGIGRAIQRALERLHQLPEGSGGRGWVRREPEDHGHQKGLPACGHHPYHQHRNALEGVHYVRTEREPYPGGAHDRRQVTGLSQRQKGREGV